MAGSETRITSAHARRLDVAMIKPFGISGGAQDEARNVLVTIELRGGVRGFGEAAPFPAFNGETQERALADLERALPLLVGADASDPRATAGRVRERTDRMSASALCAIETAVVDACARAHGLSLRAYFGGADLELVTDVTVVTGTAEDAARDAAERRAFRTLKIKVGGTDVDADVRRVVAVRDARPDATLLLDANGGLALDDALRLAAELRRRGVVVSLFEQPIAALEWDALAEVRAKTGLRVALDESVACARDVELSVRHRAADAVNVKIMKSGVFEAAAIAAAARTAGLDRMIGGLVETRLAMGTSACIAAGLGGFAVVDLDTPLFLAADPFVGGYVYRDDCVDLRPVDLGHGCVPAEST